MSTNTRTATAAELRACLDALTLMLTHDITPAVRSHVEHLRAVYLIRWSDAVIRETPKAPA